MWVYMGTDPGGSLDQVTVAKGTDPGGTWISELKVERGIHLGGTVGAVPKI